MANQLKLVGRHRDGADEAAVESVAANILDITTVANSAANISTVITNLSTINDNASNMDIVADNINDVNTVADNESSIASIISNLTDIQNASSIAELANKSITLSIGSSVVVGSQYTDIQASINYAKSVLQYGGELTINVPAGTWSMSSPVSFGSEIKVKVVGQGVSNSTVDFNITDGDMIDVSDSGLTIIDLTLSQSFSSLFPGEPVNLISISGSKSCLTSSNVSIENPHGSSVIASIFANINCNNTDVSGDSSSESAPLIKLSKGAKGMFYGTITNIESNSAKSVVVSEQSRLVLGFGSNNCVFDFPNDPNNAGSSAKAVTANGNSKVLGDLITLPSGFGNAYSPSADTIGNQQSIIVTN